MTLKEIVKALPMFYFKTAKNLAQFLAYTKSTINAENKVDNIKGNSSQAQPTKFLIFN